MRYKHLLLLAGALTVGTLVALGCSSDAPGALVTAKPEAGVVDAASDAPAPLDASGDGSLGDGAVDGGDGSTVVAQCSPSATWINPQAVGVSGKAVFGAITADETSIAWIDGTTLHWADRAVAGDPWGSESSRNVPTVASSHLAISADGLRVVVVIDAGKNFGELTRASKAANFGGGAPDSSRFGSIAFAISEAPPAARVDDPVLAADDAHFYFTLDLPSATSTIRESELGDAGAAWPLGAQLSQPELAPQASALRRPTGISDDRLTLFYWDESDSAEHAAFRPSVADDFATFVGLGAKPGSQVDKTCTRIYYGVPLGFEYASRQ